jgi:hypothetical protein
MSEKQNKESCSVVLWFCIFLLAALLVAVFAGLAFEVQKLKNEALAQERMIRFFCDSHHQEIDALRTDLGLRANRQIGTTAVGRLILIATNLPMRASP